MSQAPTAIRHNLPAQTTSLVGREQEVVAIRERLQDPSVRLLTLTGPGGTGKTRLALEVAEGLLAAYPDGVFAVVLAPIHDPALVISAIAQTLGVREGRVRGQPLLATLQAFMRSRRLLLVLDNFEHVLAAAPAIAELLDAAPGLTVLATSREILHIYGEQTFSVPPLRVVDPRRRRAGEDVMRYDAVRLFVERAEAVAPNFTLSDEESGAIVDICYRLDGLPLAIELAAARVRLLPPQALLGRLEQRLGLLTGGTRDLPARQRTLRATIDWSYALLSPEEQALFRRLGVFVGGCTIEAAEIVATASWPDGMLAPDTIETLQSLLDKSLIRQETAPDGEPRFVMLETIRDYALEALAAAAEAYHSQAGHADYFLALTDQAGHAVAHSPAWLGRLDAEDDNLRAALTWMLAQGQVEPALRMSVNLWRYWQTRGRFAEGRARLDEVLALQDRSRPTTLVAYAMLGAGSLAWNQGDFVMARSLAEQGLASCRELDDRWGIAQALNQLGMVATDQGDLVSARSFYSARLEIEQELGSLIGIANASSNLSAVAREQGDNAEARVLLERSLAIFRQLNDTRSVATALHNLGYIAFAEGQYDEARSLVGESLAIFRDVADTRNVCVALINLGRAAHEQGDYEAARGFHEESLAMARASGDRFNTSLGLNNLGEVALSQGDLTRARSLFESSLVIKEELGSRWSLAYTWANVAHVDRREGDTGAARTRYGESLAVMYEAGDKRGTAVALEGLAGIAAGWGLAGTAARLLGAAEALRETSGAVRARVEQATFDRDVMLIGQLLSPATFDAARQAGRSMPLQQVIDEARGLPAEPPASVREDIRSSSSAASGAPALRAAGLSEREVEVLRLVAQGLTNKEVAARLIISAHTVNMHLRSIFSKLQVSTRAAATRWAGEHDLL